MIATTWVLMLLVARAAAGGNPTPDAAGEPPTRCLHAHCLYNDTVIDITYNNELGYLSMDCKKTNESESTVIPCVDCEYTVWQVDMKNCLLPATQPILDALNWLNVTMLFNETEAVRRYGKLTLDVPESTLIAENFIGLERLRRIEIRALQDNQVRAELNFLAPLKSLRELEIESVQLPDGEPNTLSELQKLSLIQTSVKRLPAAVYASPFLTNLTVESDVDLDAVEISPELQSLELRSPATTVLVNSMPALEKMDITNWTETRPQALASCTNLREIYLTSPEINHLPNNWLASCHNVTILVIEKALNLRTLPERLFGERNKTIARVAIKEGVLEELNWKQFNEGESESELVNLELNGNRLRTIPNGTLSAMLMNLDLSSNELDSRVLEVLGSSLFEAIAYLDLSNNPRLGDVCDHNGHSALASLHSLKKVWFDNTNVSRLCRDWREKLTALQELGLRNTSVTKLTFDDLQFTKRSNEVRVLLEGAPVALLQMTSEDLNRAKQMTPSEVFFEFDADARFQCDCNMYWTRRALEQFPLILNNFTTLHCANGRLLNETRAEDMVCARPRECAAFRLPGKCSCSERPDVDPVRGRWIFRVNCTRASLEQVPLLPRSENRSYELLLADNQIVDVRAQHLENVKTLDLRNNLITEVDNETAIKLGNIEGSLQLAGNQLSCGCDAAPLLLALRGLVDRVDNATCSDGRRAKDVDIGKCLPSVAAYVSGLAALFAVAVAVIACLASRERRFFLKAVLHRWGCLCCGDVDEDDRRYDAFLTFSHKDDHIARELMKRLEPPYRLCIHHRDWIPGLRIPEQIVESVRESRRTLALVSRHFLDSTWTRAEFREAHEAAMVDARPRLVVILLEDPAALALDEQLQRYIATHTYLRWGDPWFYHKLAVALPRPRQSRYVMELSHIAPSNSRAPVRALQQTETASCVKYETEALVPLKPEKIDLK